VPQQIWRGTMPLLYTSETQYMVWLLDLP
jgi:hypothetical protein